RKIEFRSLHARLRDCGPVADDVGSRENLSVAEIDAIAGKLLSERRRLYHPDAVYAKICVRSLRHYLKRLRRLGGGRNEKRGCGKRQGQGCPQGSAARRPQLIAL